MTEPADVPFRELTEDEVALLVAAIDPFRLREQLGPDPRWPVWDYVARTYGREHGSTQSPEGLLAGLPFGRSIDGRQPYRLYWLRETSNDGVPRDDSTFGLTIAGLHAVRSHNTRLGEMADRLAAHYGALASHAEQIPPKPYEVASWQAPLDDFTVGVRAQSSLLPLSLDAAAIADVIRHESEPIQILEAGARFTCDLRGRLLRPFLGVTTAAQYLSVAWREPSLRVGGEPPSPLTLVQTIDYLGYVIEDTHYWKASGHTEHLVRHLRSMSSAAALSQDAATAGDFDNRISSLWTVIDRFSLPEIPEKIAKRKYSGANRSVARLDYALGHIVTRYPYTEYVQAALDVIRDVRFLRVAAQHDAADTHANGARARSRFGLAPIPASWGGDWNAVRSTVARALSSIIDAVQASD